MPGWRRSPAADINPSATGSTAAETDATRRNADADTKLDCLRAALTAIGVLAHVQAGPIVARMLFPTPVADPGPGPDPTPTPAPAPVAKPDLDASPRKRASLP
jgi:hypothetical protein